MAANSLPPDIRVGFLGAGKMAQALASGFVKTGLVKACNVTASRRHPEAPNILKDMGVMVTGDNKEVVRRSNLVFIAVKPYMVAPVLKEVAETVTADKLIISIAAGITMDTLEKELPTGTRLIRVVPNLPALVGQGAAVLSRGITAQEEDVALVMTLVRSVGQCEEVPESLQDCATGVSGSGPAYAFTAIEALADGGVKMGLPRDLAMKLAAQTMLGAAKMVLESGKHPGQLKDEVCSPGGTTIAAMHKLEKAGFRGALIDAVEAATLRARELGQKK
ncbi:pyrroline-5-carboxylate reductase 2-like [Haliotis rubra]|uniref:pyrroline-5-carboxylate reductase 2-like n=1 Tax=Haliotis rubra TaxID=36100 RepID=UPI001EE57CBA|nr:pyrroline-5-carboxylate reductase 2-like [Haliotis rubra]